MKKKLSIAMSVVLMFVLAVQVFPVYANALAAPGPALSWTHVASITPYIDCGGGTYACQVTGKTDTSRISAVLILYVLGSSGYSEVSRLTSSVNMSTKLFSSNYTYATGKTYRLEVTATVTRNGGTETVTASVDRSN